MISATLPHEILEMTNKFMTDPVRILVKRDELTLEVSVFLYAAGECWSVIQFNCVFFDDRASNNFLSQLKGKSGNLILCVIFMILLQLHKLLSSVTQSERYSS